MLPNPRNVIFKVVRKREVVKDSKNYLYETVIFLNILTTHFGCKNDTSRLILKLFKHNFLMSQQNKQHAVRENETEKKFNKFL